MAMMATMSSSACTSTCTTGNVTDNLTKSCITYFVTGMLGPVTAWCKRLLLALICPVLPFLACMHPARLREVLLEQSGFFGGEPS